MKNSIGFGVVLAILSSSAGAFGATILSATQHSGYTTIEDAFENHCELSPTGAVTGYQNSGWTGNAWTTIKPISFQLTTHAVRLVMRTILKAKLGSILDGPAICDAGSVDISATPNGANSPFIVLKALDCDSSHVNQSQAAKSLLVWVANECKIKY